MEHKDNTKESHVWFNSNKISKGNGNLKVFSLERVFNQLLALYCSICLGTRQIPHAEQALSISLAHCDPLDALKQSIIPTQQCCFKLIIITTNKQQKIKVLQMLIASIAASCCVNKATIESCKLTTSTTIVIVIPISRAHQESKCCDFHEATIVQQIY